MILNPKESRMSNNVFYRVFQYTLRSFVTKTGTLVVFHGIYKFEEIARIQILFDAVGPKAVSPFKAVSREATWNARPSRWKTFGEKFYKMIRLNSGRKIRFAASGFPKLSPKVTGR